MSIFIKDIKTISIIENQKKSLYVIFDTNVFGNMLKDGAKNQIDEFLESSQKRAKRAIDGKFLYRISLVTLYECLQGNNQKEYLDLMKEFKAYEITEDINYIAARLFSYYKAIGNTNNKLPDLYMAATSILSGAGILTCDPKGYPLPLFKEIDYKSITWKSNGRTDGDVMHLLIPNFKECEKFLDSIKF